VDHGWRDAGRNRRSYEHDTPLVDPDSPVLTLLIPVRRWSDGKSAMPEGAK
jgi:hypothetical protein